MLHNICQPYLVSITAPIFFGFAECEELFVDDCCVLLSVCLSHCISQFLDVYRKGQFHQNTRG